MRLTGKRAVITGSSQGMGREIALLLAREGTQIVVNSRASNADGKAALDSVVSEVEKNGGTAIACAGPVNDVGFAEELISTCVRVFGGIDILVNNAGVFGLGAVDRVPLTHWQEVIDVNLNGTFYCARFAVAHMRAQRWGRVINCASGAAFGSIGGSCYAASKGGVIALTYAMASDLGMYGITTNAYTPQARSRLSDTTSAGGFEKAMRSRLIRGYCDEAEYRYVLGMGGAEAIAPWVAYLCLEEADYINGRVFFVEGRRIGLQLLPGDERTFFRDYAKHGAISLDELQQIAPLVFPIKNRWPKRSNKEIESMLAAIDPIYD